jgi:hypothetical protein
VALVAIEAKVTGNGFFAGATTNVSSYTVSEDSTPISPADTSGGTGTFSINVLENSSADGTMLLYADQIDLSDGSNGTTQGIVSTLSAQNGIVTVTADSRMFLMNTVVSAMPRNNTIANVLNYYLSLVGITTNISIDPTIGSLTVTWPGWKNQLWLQMKKLLLTVDAEASLVSSNITIRPIRQRTAETLKDTARGWDISQSNLAQGIEIYNYNNTRLISSLAYPDGGWSDQTTVLQVDAGQTIVQNFPVSVWLESLIQPTCSLTVGKFDNTMSVYAVTGNDGNIVSPTTWAATGGYLTVAIGADGKSVDVTAHGAAAIGPAPYRIAISTGQSNYYSSLRILGTGVFFHKDLISIPTGLTAAQTSNVVGVTVDNEFIGDLQTAMSLGLRAAQSYGAPAQTINASSVRINRAGDGGSTVYPTFNDFNTAQGAATFASFNTAQGAATFDQFNATQFATVSNVFANQSFGNVAGARLRYADHYYRIRTGTTGPDVISYTAERDSLFNDFNTVNSANTFAQFNTKWANKSFIDFTLASLWA